MVDYSKFDKLASELSDEDEAGGNRPRVTRLQAGSQVTIGTSGAVVSEPGRRAASAQPKASNTSHVRHFTPGCSSFAALACEERGRGQLQALSTRSPVCGFLTPLCSCCAGWRGLQPMGQVHWR